MQYADVNAKRAQSNRLLAFGLLSVSMVVLGLMIAVVFGVRSGFLGRVIDHIVRVAAG